MPSKYLNSLLALLHEGQKTAECSLLEGDLKDMPINSVCPNYDCFECIFASSQKALTVIKILENST